MENIYLDNSNNKTLGEWHLTKEIETPKKLQWKFGPAPHEKERKLVRCNIATNYKLLSDAESGDHFRLSYQVASGSDPSWNNFC